MAAGRITVVRGNGAVTLSLSQWALRPAATLTDREARELIAKIEDALARSGTKVAEPDGTAGLEDLL